MLYMCKVAVFGLLLLLFQPTDVDLSETVDMQTPAYQEISPLDLNPGKGRTDK